MKYRILKNYVFSAIMKTKDRKVQYDKSNFLNWVLWLETLIPIIFF